ncbi:MAG: substrate-binding domain-containing protein [Lachnospiraceae bacterium]|jgi:inositol transport system substrate-binding protein|nr:substrate-binding domain-containing protein [Lachnospiraceae bacterium]
MRKKLGILLSVVMIGMLALTGCGSDSGVASNKDIKILLVLNQMDSFRETLVAAARNTAEAEGVQLDFKDAEGSIEKQVNYLKSAEAEGYNVILCSPVSAETVVELKASAGDIPIVFINSCPDEKQLKEGKYVYAGSDEYVAGQFQAEYVLDKLAGRQEINVVLLKGEKAHSATNGRTKGVKQTLESSGKTINYVFEDYADWNQELSKHLFETFLRTGSPVDCVLCENDSMALGVIEACKEANIDLSTLPVLGVDATADGCAAIKNGEMAFTVCQSGAGQGEAAVKAAIQFAKGESVDSLEGVSEDGKYVWVPFEKVDSTNVSQYSN